MNFLPKPSEAPLNFADLPYTMRLQEGAAAKKHWEWAQKFLKDAIENERRQIFKAADSKIAEFQRQNGNYWRDSQLADLMLKEIAVALEAGDDDMPEKIRAALEMPRPDWLEHIPLPPQPEESTEETP